MVKNAPRKFHSSPLKNGGKGRRSGFLLGETVTFQGRAVKLREGSASNTNGGVNMKFMRDLL